MENIPENQPKRPKNNPARHLYPVDLAKNRRRLHVILKREILRLMDESYVGKLSEDSINSLIKCANLLKDFEKTETEELNSLTDEELEALVKKGEKK